MLYACDQTWWRHYFRHVATTFKGELWTISDGARQEFDLHWIFGTEGAGLSRHFDHIHTGKNSGYQAISLAYLFGASRIVLLGYDFGVGPNGLRHWHGDHPRGLGNGGESRYVGWVREMSQLAQDLERTPCKVVNASRRTALKCYRRLTLENALHEISDLVGA